MLKYAFFLMKFLHSSNDLNEINARFGRPGVECYCQHDSGAAVIQLQFLINEVGKLL